MNWRITLAIARKDVMDAVRNLYILSALVLPIGLSLFFRLLLPSFDGAVTMTIVVHDPGASQLASSLRAQPEMQVLEVSSVTELPEEVERRAVGGLAVPLGFDEAVAAGETPELTVYVNQRRGGGETARFQRLVEQEVWALTRQPAPARITWASVAAQPGLFEKGGLRFDRYLLTVLLVMSVTMSGAFVVPLLLVEEKEKRTMEVLLLSPAKPTEVAGGKAAAGLVYCLVTAGLLLALNQGWAGNWPVTLVALGLGSLFVVAVGLLIGGVFHSVNQVNTWSSVIMLALLTPSWIGVLETPSMVEAGLRLMPTHYLASVLSRAMAGEASPATVGKDLAVLAVSVILVFGAVVWTLKRERTTI